MMTQTYKQQQRSEVWNVPSCLKFCRKPLPQRSEYRNVGAGVWTLNRRQSGGPWEEA